MVGTLVISEIRCSSIAARNAAGANAGITTDSPPRAHWVMNCEQQPVTWNSGTEISETWSGPRSIVRQRMTLSTDDRKFSWVTIAPLGRPVVPDV